MSSNLNSELDNLEDFIKLLKSRKGKDINKFNINFDENKSQDVIGIKQFFNKYINELKFHSYFNFIPKDSSKISENKFKLAVELKSILNYYQFQSYIIGANSLYFLLLFQKRKHFFSPQTLFSMFVSSGIAFMFYRYHYFKVFTVMNELFEEDIEFLADKMRKQNNGFTQRLQEEFKRADLLIQKAENEKYEINPTTKEKSLKSAYLNKTYSFENRETLVDLVKFYADWLYSPIDQELENKLYFLDLETSPEEYFYPKLKNKFDALSPEERSGLDLVFGIKITEKNKI